MNRRFLESLGAFLILLLFSTAAAADLVSQWNERAWPVMTAERVTGGGGPARLLAMMHGAMYQAANSGSDVSPEAAAHAAARGVLVRLFAQLNAAIFDAYLAVFDAKYTYNWWRPVTAIRNGDRHNNPAVGRDAAWTPIIDTPMHPEYPCAHCTVDGAAGAVLKAFWGTGPLPEFTLTYDAMPGVTRKYTSIQQLEDEISMARIWGGVHFRTSNEVGHLLGKQVGEYVLANYK